MKRRSDMGDEQNELRVTDRRRVYLDPDGEEQVNAEVETPNLKPSYVEELEARTRAAEKPVAVAPPQSLAVKAGSDLAN